MISLKQIAYALAVERSLHFKKAAEECAVSQSALSSALAACKLAGAGAHSLSATSLATLIQLVAGKMGTTLVPEMALEQLVDANPALARVPLREPGPHREIAFVVRPNYPALANIELLMQLFRGELERQVPKNSG